MDRYLYSCAKDPHNRLIRSRILRVLIIVYLGLLNPITQAETSIGFYLGASSDTNTLDSKNVSTTLLYDGYVYMTLLKAARIYLGIEYNYLTWIGPNADSTSAQLIATNPMVGLKWMLDRSQTYYVSALGTPLSQAIYKESGQSKETWTGTTFGGQLGVRPEISENWRVNVAITYLMSQYVSKAVSSTGTASSDKSSFNRTFWTPTLGIEYSF